MNIRPIFSGLISLMSAALGWMKKPQQVAAPKHFGLAPWMAEKLARRLEAKGGHRRMQRCKLNRIARRRAKRELEKVSRRINRGHLEGNRAG